MPMSPTTILSVEGWSRDRTAALEATDERDTQI